MIVFYVIDKNATKRDGPLVCANHKLALLCHLVKMSWDMSFLCCMGNGTGALRSGEMDSQNPQPSV